VVVAGGAIEGEYIESSEDNSEVQTKLTLNTRENATSYRGIAFTL